jgi:hypothetical protein
MERVSVKDKLLVLPDGMRYRMLVLPDTARMPAEILLRIRDLVKDGATVVGPKPVQDPGLKNYPACDDEVKKIAAGLWGNCDGKDVLQHHFGKGRVCWNKPLREILQEDEIAPDFEHDGADTYIDFIHRSAAGMEIYFLANRNNSTAQVNAIFRVNRRQPEIWDPVTTETRIAAFSVAGGRSVVPMEFQPFQSFFVIFPKQAAKGKAVGPAGAAAFSRYSNMQQLEGEWTVKFDPAWGGPAEVKFATLQDWTQRPEPGIRYYSGTARYIKQFNMDAAAGSRKKLFLHLGTVKHIAEVWLNGQSLGIVWTAPWRVDISVAVKPGNNLLEIEVVNLWPNRLIGDAALPPEERRTHTNITFKSDMPLVSSGLLGPVVIQEIIS